MAKIQGRSICDFMARLSLYMLQKLYETIWWVREAGRGDFLKFAMLQLMI